ncbi:hypothetical protein, partial [Citrobacter amalonaticus]|uniref:hypothetical protein n=1 Tax=Citrobacter amalonaticus TaxID=35703 RepID=UPI0035A246DA
AKNLKDAPKKPLRGEVTEPIKPEAIVALLTENGNMDTVALASVRGSDGKGNNKTCRFRIKSKRRYLRLWRLVQGSLFELPGWEYNSPASARN